MNSDRDHLFLTDNLALAAFLLASGQLPFERCSKRQKWVWFAFKNRNASGEKLAQDYEAGRCSVDPLKHYEAIRELRRQMRSVEEGGRYEYERNTQ
jgi:hypothetical protein